MNPEIQAADMIFGAIWWLIKVCFGLLILIFLIQIRNHLKDLKGIVNPKSASAENLERLNKKLIRSK